MDMILTRHRAGRLSAVGLLQLGAFEVITLERRSDMLEEGTHEVAFDGDTLYFGDHPVTTRRRADGTEGAVQVGLAATRNRVSESETALDMLITLIRDLTRDGDDLRLEVVDTVDYAAVDNEVL